MGSDPNVFRYKLFCMGSGLSIIPGMVDYSKTDLRFPTSGQQAHDAQIIHLVLFIHSLEMFIFFMGSDPGVFPSRDRDLHMLEYAPFYVKS